MRLLGTENAVDGRVYFSLTPRQQQILLAVIQDYISTGEPVGSRTLSKKYALGLSPATIRNELADLEEEGLLKQPHTSAGRIPSDTGYRLFVDHLMERRSSLPPEQERMIADWRHLSRDLPDLMQQTAKLTAVLSGCTAIVRAPRQAKSRIKYLQLLAVSESEALLVMITDHGSVTNQLVSLPAPLSPEELGVITNFLNEHLRNQPLDRLTQYAVSKISREMARYEQVLHDLYRRVSATQEAGERLYLSHTSYLAQQPEFSEGGKVGQLLNLLEQEKLLIELLDTFSHPLAEVPEGAVRVSIGTENPLPDLHACSLVTGTYRLGDQIVGEIGILGPTRMEYATAVRTVEVMTERLSRALNELFGLD